MTKIVYRIMFDNGNAVTFDSTVDVDLHKIGMKSLLKLEAKKNDL